MEKKSAVLNKGTVYQVIAEICNKKGEYAEYSRKFREYEKKDESFTKNKNDELNIAHWFCHSANEWQKLHATNKVACNHLVISLKGVSGKNGLHRVQRTAIAFATNELKLGKVNVLTFDNLHAIIRKLEDGGSKKPKEKTAAAAEKIEQPATAVNE